MIAVIIISNSLTFLSLQLYFNDSIFAVTRFDRIVALLGFGVITGTRRLRYITHFIIDYGSGHNNRSYNKAKHM